MFPKTVVNERRERERERRRTRPLLKYGEHFYCRYKRERRQREECRPNMASRLNQTQRGEREGEQERSQGPTKTGGLGQETKTKG